MPLSKTLPNRAKSYQPMNADGRYDRRGGKQKILRNPAKTHLTMIGHKEQRGPYPGQDQMIAREHRGGES